MRRPLSLVLAGALALVAGGGVACAPEPAPVGPPPARPPVAPPPTPVAQVPTPPTLRLPRVARPLRYDLAFWLDPHATITTGTVGIDLDVLEPTGVLWLNATDLRIESATLDTAAGPLTPRVVPGGADFVGFTFDRDLAPGKARLTVRFQGSIDPERSRGIYSSREVDGETYLYTFFEPIDARRAFPCFDEPSYKVPWKVSLHVPRADVALSNAPVAAEHDEEGGRKVVEMAETPPLPSYLVAFVVGPFDVLDAGTAGHHGTPLRFVVPRGRGPETAYAARITPKLVGALEDYFGMPYPFRKLDVAVVPRYWGTMEHPGLVAMGQPLTLIAPGQESVEREQHYADIAVHELAHYWFGDYVTTAWWDDTWLNEALGTWMDETATAAVEPGWGFDFERIARAGYGMRVDALGSAKRIRQPVETPDDIGNAFDSAITYYKGQAVLSMFESWMGKDHFRHAIRGYVAKHAWGNATAEDFFGAMNQEVPGAGAAMKTFVDQPGFPAVSLETKCTGKDVSVTVKQHRYHVLGDALDPEAWTFPVCLRYSLGKGASGRTCAVLSGETTTVALRADACPAWIVGNADGAGYYGVDYTPAQLRAALATREAIDADRIALLRDAGQLVGSGELPLGDALAFVPPTASSGRRQIVQAGLDLVGIARASALTDGQARRRAAFLRGTYGAAMAKLGLARRPADDDDAQRIRPTLIETVGVAGDDEALRKRARGLAFAWLADEHAIAPELVDVILEAAAKSNDERLFAAILQRAHAEPDHTRIGRLLGALGAFTAPPLVRQADELLASNAFDVRDALVIVREQLADRASQEQAWAFVKASFDTVSTRMRSDDVLVGYFRPIQGFCDEPHQRDVQAFFASRAARFDGGPRALANAVEAIGQCAAVLQRNQASLDAFLARY